MLRKSLSLSLSVLVAGILAVGNSYALDPQPKPSINKSTTGKLPKQHQYKPSASVKATPASIKQDSIQKGKCGGWCGAPQQNTVATP